MIIANVCAVEMMMLMPKPGFIGLRAELGRSV